VALANICPFSAIDKIITGKETDPAIIKKFADAGVTFEIT
jgi:DeoR/GlpR family transcriptional regulator of sugar metabolism